jgi:oxygen-dependent protoporphyrinogen oxidase
MRKSAVHAAHSEHTLLTLLGQCYTTARCELIPTAARNHPLRHRHARGFRSCASWSSQRVQSGAQERQLAASVRIIDPHELGRDSGVVKAQGSSARRDDGLNFHKDPREIAVLGGGITGLASAYYLSKELPEANITLYEGSERLGGWLKTKHVNVGDGTVAFEQGPRSLRPGTPAGMVTLNLVSAG